MSDKKQEKEYYELPEGKQVKFGITVCPHCESENSVRVSQEKYNNEICSFCSKIYRYTVIGENGGVKWKRELPSRHQVGDSVLFYPETDSYVIPAYVRAIIFTNSKIRYSLYLIDMKSTIHNVDSILVYDYGAKDFGKKDFGDDNYS